MISVLVLIGVITYVQLRFATHILHSIDSAPTSTTALILGASVKNDKEPSDALRDRLLVGKALYDQKRVEKLLVTGDDGSYRVDEVTAMKRFLLDHGVPSDAILVDGQGYRTYESCKRAVQTYKITDAIIVTQRFHLGRALYLCNMLGMQATGIGSDITTYQRIIFFTARDILSSVKAWWDIHIVEPASPIQGIHT